MTKSKKGFTLIELIVVLAILAVIAAIAVPTAFGAIDKAKLAADTATIESYNSAIRTQGTLLSAGSFLKAENTVGEAITMAKMSTGATVQSSNLKITWTPASSTAMGYFEVTDTGTAVAKGKTWVEIMQAYKDNKIIDAKGTDEK
ncbi:MAG: prepilin-type N-terminal cleavage/methylation domain-containing protein [Oscillospiraceae bacterium]